MNKAVQLANKVDGILNKSSYENGTVTIKGVRNLSRADLEAIKMYSSTYAKTGRFSGLRQPTGYVKEVLDKYDIKDNQDRFSGLF